MALKVPGEEPSTASITDIARARLDAPQISGTMIFVRCRMAGLI
jgi:hypothetical protein